MEEPIAGQLKMLRPRKPAPFKDILSVTIKWTLIKFKWEAAYTGLANSSRASWTTRATWTTRAIRATREELEFF